jgi:hypothetical protein
MKKTLFLFLFVTFFTKVSIAQECSIPNQPAVAYGIDFNGTQFDCGSGSDLYFFYFESLTPFSLNVILEDITAGSSSSHPISGTYDADLDRYTTEFFVTVYNGHLMKLFYEYSEPGFYCKKLAFQFGISQCSDTDEDGDGFASDIDCNDNSSDDFPFGVEYCDGYDNNCNGLVDDADSKITNQPVWVLDEDKDGFYVEGSEIRTCFKPDENYINKNDSNFSYDCNDNDPEINPLTVWYRDQDSDGYANSKINS